MKRKRRLKKKPIAILICTIILIVVLSIFISRTLKELKYRETMEYKLLNQGYTKEEIKILEEKTNEEFMNSLLETEYDKMYLEIINEKYYIKGNLQKYIDYYEEHLNSKAPEVITTINVGADRDYYSNVVDSDTSKEKLLLVNKYSKLSENYEPTDLVDISNQYSYGENQKLRSEAYEWYITMYNMAKNEGIKIIVNSSYRSYKDQDETYNYYLNNYSQEYTDAYAARPGYSEHQTGLAVDVIAPGYNRDTFDQSEAYKWLENNAYKYGFILRYPKGKEKITGFNYEPWHYRYVGQEAAKKIHEENITYDEYYAYYVENVSNS